MANEKSRTAFGETPRGYVHVIEKGGQGETAFQVRHGNQTVYEGNKAAALRIARALVGQTEPEPVKEPPETR